MADSVVAGADGNKDGRPRTPTSGYGEKAGSGERRGLETSPGHHAESLPTSKSEFPHTFATHNEITSSLLSRESDEHVSFKGFGNLAMIFLVVGNLRLVVENYIKYGIMLEKPGRTVAKRDLKITICLFVSIPIHMFFAWGIESWAGKKAKLVKVHKTRPPKNKYPTRPSKAQRKEQWGLIRLLHILNIVSCGLIASMVVYTCIFHPLLGMICEAHAVIVGMKLISYALTNRDLRDAYIESYPVSGLYIQLPYPLNLTLSNLLYFWWAPTLVYQPVYVRSSSFRRTFFFKRVGEVAGIGFALWVVVSQYATPLLSNAIPALNSLNVTMILERILKLSTISLVSWLAGFFCIFHSSLNAVAEIMYFGDRRFYGAWWNSISVGEYWRTWNKPVHNYFVRHVYVPLLQRGWTSAQASFVVFTISAILHELLFGIPAHSVRGVAFVAMMAQIPLIFLTAPLEKWRGPWAVVGNCIFWGALCVIGQPFAVLYYFYKWNCMYR